MKLKSSIALLAGMAAFALQTTSTYADPAQAEDDAYKMATKYTQQGYAMAPTNTNGVGASGTLIRFIVPVSKGLDYIFLAGIDKFVDDVDIYVYDEVGNLIKEDRRSTRRAGIGFRSAYNGTVQVYLHLQRTSGMGAYSVLIGRRGVARDKNTLTDRDGSLVTDPSTEPSSTPAPAPAEAP